MRESRLLEGQGFAVSKLPVVINCPLENLAVILNF